MMDTPRTYEALQYVAGHLPALEQTCVMQPPGYFKWLAAQRKCVLWALDVGWSIDDLLHAVDTNAPFPAAPFGGMRIKWELDWPVAYYSDVRARGLCRMERPSIKDNGKRISVIYGAQIPVGELSEVERKLARAG